MIEDIHLAEFNRCRDEIDNRTEISERLVLGQVTVLGIAVSLPEKFPLLEKAPEVFLGLSAVTSFLWLFWLAHTRQISKLSGYIAMRLAPQLRDLPDSDRRTQEWALGWEEYTRIMDKLGSKGYNLPYPPRIPKKQKSVLRMAAMPLNAAWWKTFLFAGVSPVLWYAYYKILGGHNGVLTLARILTISISVILWFAAIWEYISVRQVWKKIDERVVESFREKG